MTPTDRDTERAREIVARHPISGNYMRNGRLVAIQHFIAADIAQALAAVRAEEREECAKVAERDERSELAKDVGHVPSWLKHGFRIGKAIRERAP